jgi:PAS domain-containing protein
MGARFSAERAVVARWGLLYLAVGLIVAIVQSDNGQTAWYPAIAVGVALLLLHGLRWWPVVLAVELVVSVVQSRQISGGLISAAITTAETVAMVWLLRRFRFRTTFERVNDVVLMGVVATVVTAAGSTLGNLALHLTNSTPWSYTDGWTIWTVGDLTGTVLVLPILLLFANRQPTALGAPVLARRLRIEAWVVSVLTAGILATYFSTVRVHELTNVNAGPLTLCLMPIIWIAVRFGLARTAALIVALDAVTVVAYVGIGPHLVARGANSPDSLDLVTLQLPILAVGMAALGVAAAIEAVQRAGGRERVLLNASPVAIVALDGNGIVQSWNAAAELIFGYSAAEAIGHTPPMIINAPEFDERRNRFVDGEVTIARWSPAASSVHR